MQVSLGMAIVQLCSVTQPQPSENTPCSHAALHAFTFPGMCWMLCGAPGADWERGLLGQGLGGGNRRSQLCPSKLSCGWRLCTVLLGGWGGGME